MSTIKLSDIQKSAEANYGDFEVEIPAGKKKETAKFRPILRCDKATRTAYGKAVNPLTHVPEVEDGEDIDEDIVDVLLAAYKAGFMVTAYSPNDFELLNNALGDDVGLWKTIYDEYNSDGDPGEA